VPFAECVDAALLLATPSSAARVLANGAHHIASIGLVRIIAAGKGMHDDEGDPTVALVDGRLEPNRKKIS
jgi:hypothetical protein